MARWQIGACPPRLNAPAYSRFSFEGVSLNESVSLSEGVWFYSLPALADSLGVNVDLMTVSLKVLLENLARHEDGVTVTRDDIAALAHWPDSIAALDREVAFHPGRVLMPDSSGVPLLIDLAAMRDAMVERGLDPHRVDPLVPTDLVACLRPFRPGGFRRNTGRVCAQPERRAGAQSRALRRGQMGDGPVRQPAGRAARQRHRASGQHRVFRPGGRAASRAGWAHDAAFPDTLVGMDSHTTMVNALGVFGWGVGGIEAATAMFGQPVGLPTPRVVGCRFTGAPRAGVDVYATSCSR